MGEFRHCFLLVWRNFKMKLCHPWITLIELLLLFICLSLLLKLYGISRIQSDAREIIYKPYTIDYIPNKNWTAGDNWHIYYAPQSSFLDNVMFDLGQKLNLTPIAFRNEDELLKSYLNSTSEIIAGVLFDDNITEGMNSTAIIKYRIRPETVPNYHWNIHNLFPQIPIKGPLDRHSLWGTDYMTLGFLPILHAVAMCLMKTFSNSTMDIVDMFNVKMQRFPYPASKYDHFHLEHESYFTVLICAGLLYPFANLAKDIAHEKEKKLKEAMKAMGVENWMIWMAWYITSLIYFGLFSGIITFMLCTKFTANQSVFNYSDPFIVFLWGLLYSSSLISFCFFLTTFFHTRNSAMGGAFILFFMILMPYLHTIIIEHRISRTVRLIFSLFPNTLFGYSVRIWIHNEALGIGLRWKNINATDAVSLGLSMSYVFAIFILNSVIYFLLTWYIEAVFPGKSTQPEPWYFPFTSSYWVGEESKSTVEVEGYGQHELKPEYFEKEPYGVRPSIELKNLTKVYKKDDKPTINNMSLKAYKGITVLLGHDGSGKSTLISLLLGKFYCSSGNAYIKGCNITVPNEARAIPRFLGFCPDYDVFFEDLSVEENLNFFCRIKGFETEVLKSQIQHVLDILDLGKQRTIKASLLSDSCKRKLSIGFALIGESEVVIIDEPTARMETYSQRIVWDALKMEGNFRTIFITSNYMKEAEAIGDRIGIMDGGELHCYGSSAFIKKRYGAGYYLTFEKGDSNFITDLSKLIMFHIPQAKSCGSGDELRYFLPLHRSYLYEFLFDDLEKKKEDFKIPDYTVSQITMEQLFDKVSLKTSSGSYSIANSVTELFLPESFSSTGDNLESQDLLFAKERNTYLNLLIQHATAFWKKRFLFSIRHILLFLSQILVLPLVFIASNAFSPKEILGEARLLLNLDLYNSTGITLEIPYSLNPSQKLSKDLSGKYISLFKNLTSFLVDSREETLNEHLLEVAEENYLDYHKKYIISAHFSGDENKSSITAFYNNKALHSAPISLLSVQNAILKHVTKGNVPYSFEVTNHPLPLKESWGEAILGPYQLFSDFLIGQDLLFGISILMAGFIIVLILDKSSYSKRLQHLNGLSPFSYWLLSFVYDFSIYIVSIILLLVLFSMNGMYGCSNLEQLGRVALLFTIHGVAGLLFVYLCSFFVEKPSAGYVFIFLYNMLGLVFQFPVIWLEKHLSKDDFQNFDLFFSLFLSCYCMSQGFLKLYKNFRNNQVCNNLKVQLACRSKEKISAYYDLYCCKAKCGSSCLQWDDNYFSWESPGIGKQLISLTVQICVYLLIIILCEMKILRKIGMLFRCCPIRQNKTLSEQNTEIQKQYDDFLNTPLSELINDHHLIVKQLTKYKRSNLVIDKLTFGVAKGECFGLVGIEEPGKTATLRVITGDLKASSGKVYVNGNNILKEPGKIQGEIGVCLQVDTLLNHLTGEETLQFYANLRGIPERKISNFITELSKSLAMDYCLKQKVKEYSFSSKRKLSVAIAIIGTPSLIILDEPTSKMDPIACRYVWNTLLQASAHGCSILLTTERMDECEAVCNRIGIMTNGKFVYLGNLMDLKKKYGQGYRLSMKLKKSHKGTRTAVTDTKTNTEEAKFVIDNLFPQAVLKGDFPNFLSYYFPDKNINWTELFRELEKGKKQKKIANYSVNETTLDDILFYESLDYETKKDDIKKLLKKYTKTKK